MDVFQRVAEAANAESLAVIVCQSDGRAAARGVSGPGGAMAGASPREIGRCELWNCDRPR